MKGIFDEENLDKPISTVSWAKLVQIVVRPHREESTKLLKMYVYGLASGNNIKREDAIGGLVKILS